MKLSGHNLKIKESNDDIVELHKGSQIEFVPQEILVNAVWTDQGWGN